MKTRTFYHGTSADNLESILKYGLSTDETKIWNCSSDEIYLWCPIGCGEADCLDISQYEQAAFKCASESGQAACSIAKDCRVVVLKIEIKDNDYLRPDDSHENMAGKGAYICSRNIQPDEIIEINISNDLSLIKGYFISLQINNELNACNFSNMELTVARCFESNYEIFDFIEEIIEFKELVVFN